MQLILSVLPYVQIALSVILVASILMQQTGSGLGGALGGSDAGTLHHTRRGFEYFLFVVSIICAILFAVSALLAVILQ